jgi:hypothetical protein
MNNISRWQEWLTVFAYLGITVFIIWRIFAPENK